MTAMVHSLWQSGFGTQEGRKASKQDWYTNAEEEIENVHFSLPHIQNLFEDGTYRYYWVIS